MNQKANVSKELNAKHRKILEGLLKLPENRECADCKTRGPRWASLNLGIFICMQCSGAHRSLGVHISQVRSATLDTWLPEQIAFIQSMGNEKSNSYWEAELPPKYDRVGIENFIRAKYQEKRWVPRKGKTRPPSETSLEKTSVYRPGPEIASQKQMNSINNASEEKKIVPPPIMKDSSSASVTCTPSSFGTSQRPALNPKPQGPVQNSEPAMSITQSVKQEKKMTAGAKPEKVDYATELFNLLCVDDASGKPFRSLTGCNVWVDFQTAEVESSSGRGDEHENATPSKQEAERIFQEPHMVAPSSGKPQKDTKSDIMNLFEKSSTACPYPLHQQQTAMLSQRQQQQLMAAAVKSNVQNFSLNSSYSFCQNWESSTRQVPGMTMPLRATSLQKHIHVGNNQQMHPSGNNPTSSLYRPGPVGPINGAASIGSGSAQPQIYYDLSSLTQGMPTKR